ncbi:MAG: alcohol dehydrogenase catalytic domain-containing protein [Chloroflexi bacterium]|nr:alcohol dehydrogenase catalytic domain-containing protein [Chloroflexota bacterium]
MLAARLHGPKNLQIDEIEKPPPPGPGQVLLHVTAVGICGSDLHNYEDARIGDTVVAQPVILGHEFAGVIEAVGPDAHDGNDQPLCVGQRVAADPATPCFRCENCEHGYPNLCTRLHFHGLFPDDGALCEYMITGSRGCFPVPNTVTDSAAALLEPLGVAIHAVDLGALKVANSVAVIGVGSIGMLITQLAALSGAHPIFAFDKFRWRAEKALKWGATEAYTLDDGDSAQIVMDRTGGRGVDVVFEAAWADESVNTAARMARLGGRLVLVGIPGDDNLQMQHSQARRKGLEIMMSRRMKHTYPRAIQLATEHPQALDLDKLISHRFPLKEAPQAFAMNFAYQDAVQKVIIDVSAS